MGFRPNETKGLLGLAFLLCVAGCETPPIAPEQAAVLAGLEQMVMPPTLPGRVQAMPLPGLDAPPQVGSAQTADAPPAAPLARPASPPAEAPSVEAPAQAAVAAFVSPAMPAALPEPPASPAPAMPPAAQAPNPPAPLPAAVAMAGSAPPRPGAQTTTRDGPRVQLVAAGSEAEANRHWARLLVQAPDLTEGRQPVIVPFERPGQPTIYRLRVGSFGSANAALDWCMALRQRNLGCWVTD